MRTYETPNNLVELLNGVIGTASETAFYSRFIPRGLRIESLEEFPKIPVTPLAEYRKQRLSDVVATPSEVQWIVGPRKGQSPNAVAVAEGPDEAANRFDIFMDTIKDALPQQRERTCAIVSSPHRRYFAAEIATILIHSGIPTHVFLNQGNARTYERLNIVRPDILVILSDDFDEECLPTCIELCITFRRSRHFRKFRQLDLYHVDELGFLGQSHDFTNYILNNDVYLYERSVRGNLIVTALHNRVQPLLRIGLPDKAKSLGSHSMQLANLSRE